MNELLDAKAIMRQMQWLGVPAVARLVADLVKDQGINPETDLPPADQAAVLALLRLNERASAGDAVDLADFFREINAGIPKWTGQAQNELRLAGFESVGWFLRQKHGRWASKKETEQGQRLAEAYAERHRLAPKRLRKGRFTVEYWPVAALEGALGGQSQ